MEVESGELVNDVCSEHGISDANYYNWKAECGGMEASDIKWLMNLDDESCRLNQIYEDVRLERTILKDIIEKRL